MTEEFKNLSIKLIEFEKLNTNSSSEYKRKVTDVLKQVVNELKDEECRNALISDDISRLCKLLQAFIPVPLESSSALPDDRDINLCTECVRCLRNACVQNEQNQNWIGQSGAVGNIKDLIAGVCSSESQESISVLIRCAVQLAGNLVSGNTNTRTLLWRELFPQSFLSVFNYEDTKASTYCCMLLHECLDDELHLQQLIKQPEGQQIIEAVLRLCEEEMQHDFSLQIMQKLVTTSEFMLSAYDNLPVPAKLTVLDILAAVISQADGPSSASNSPTVPMGEEGCKNNVGVPVFTIAYLAEQFEDLAKGAMALITEEQSRHSTQQMIPVLTLRLLKVLGIAASNHEVYKPLQDRESLLQTTLELLERANLSGSSKQVPSTLHMNHEETSPVYGLKRDLVRLIGNMCYKHKPNQHKVRELQGIPLILEHCKIHDQNPFISQWAILTIRNLCADNQENQAFIAGMTTQGAAPSTDFLREMGVEVEMRDGIPYVKTTAKKK
ncbi:ataxin-10-like [Amphiura filiformis]|uniref:ataxin-10-like n=1 Tax=Amphiura filiformis TaxID=82378 RepID=UPI003B20C5C2